MPCPEFISPFRYRNKKSLTPMPDKEKEKLIEEMITNRELLKLPEIQVNPIKKKYRNIRDRIMRTNSLFYKPSSDRCDSLLGALRAGIVDKTFNDYKEVPSWQLKPLRLWKLRPFNLIEQRKHRKRISLTENNIESLKSKIYCSKTNIKSEIDLCQDHIIEILENRKSNLLLQLTE